VIGDGILTPAISVLSAVSGIKEASSSLNDILFFGRCGDNCIFGDHSQFVQHAAFWYSKGGVFFCSSFSAVVCLYCTYWNLQHHPE
jgi:hypothetical protein